MMAAVVRLVVEVAEGFLKTGVIKDDVLMFRVLCARKRCVDVNVQVKLSDKIMSWHFMGYFVTK